jgi:hypothetical protein
LVVAGIGIVLSAASAGAAMSAADSGPTASRHSPPAPRVRTLGVTRTTQLVSYCWTYRTTDHSGTGVCADGTVRTPKRTLQWRSSRKLVVDFRLPAHDVGVQAIRLTNGQEQNSVQPKVSAEGTSGRRWEFRLPRAAANDNVLLVGARFRQGDVEAELGIRHISGK